MLFHKKNKYQRTYTTTTTNAWNTTSNQTSGAPLAVCALKTQLGLPVVRVYATKRRTSHQRRAALTSALGFTWCNAVPLYAWAEIHTERVFPMPFQYSIYMANSNNSSNDHGFDAKPINTPTSIMLTGSPDFQIVGRTDVEDASTGCALLTVDGSNSKEPCFKLSISRGIDPALLICFAAVVDETMEHAMRRFCQERGVATTRPFQAEF